MLTAIFIVARLGSTRLPRKVLMPVAGKPILSHLIDRLRHARQAEMLVLCTSTLALDDPLGEIAAAEGIECYRGSPDDVVDRIACAAEQFGVDFFAVAEGDEIFCDPEFVDLAIETYRRTSADLVVIDGLPIGAHMRGIRGGAAQTVRRLKLESHSEGWLRYFTETGRFRVVRVGVDVKADDIPVRLTLDYPEDLDLIRAIYERLHVPGEPFGLQAVLQLLRSEPELLAINGQRRHSYAGRAADYPPIRMRDSAAE